jgi:hypothetical protein
MYRSTKKNVINNTKERRSRISMREENILSGNAIPLIISHRQEAHHEGEMSKGTCRRQGPYAEAFSNIENGTKPMMLTRASASMLQVGDIGSFS